MKTLKFAALGLVTIATLSGCTIIPGASHSNRGQPEALLEVSTQTVTVDLSQGASLGQLIGYISNSEPARASIECSNSVYCDKAASILDRNNIPYDQVSGASNAVTLVYEEVAARDCDNRYYTNHINPYNLPHPSFGCAIAVNQVQMVRDRRQYTDPLVLGPYDGHKAAQNYDTYLSREIDDRVIEARPESVTGNSGSGGQQ